MPAKPIHSYTCKLSREQASELRARLDKAGAQFRDVPYAVFAAVMRDYNVVYYESQKLVVQGKGTQEFVEFVLEPEILREAKVGYEAVHNPALYDPRIGVDESGKGDFFGPMCVAGAYVNEAVIRKFEEAGVRDSKQIGSDRRILELADLIRETPGCVTTVVPIGNAAYNRLFLKLKSVNAMLAWGHARVIENLLGLQYQMNPPPLRAVSDQFAHSKDVIASALMKQGKTINLVQRHKAEEDIAVAAASILARAEFVKRLAAMSRQYQIEFPKGASREVEKIGIEFVQKFGAEKLGEVCKMHFRTSFRIRGLPEPPKKEFRRSKRSQ